MDEKTNLWDKKTDDLTVGDVVKLNVGALAVMVGGFVALGLVAHGAEKAASKFRTIRADRKMKNELNEGE